LQKRPELGSYSALLGLHWSDSTRPILLLRLVLGTTLKQTWWSDFHSKLRMPLNDSVLGFSPTDSDLTDFIEIMVCWLQNFQNIYFATAYHSLSYMQSCDCCSTVTSNAGVLLVVWYDGKSVCTSLHLWRL